LGTGEEAMREQLLGRFRMMGLQVSSVEEVIGTLKLDRNTARKLIQLMVKENALVKITEEMYIDRSVMDKMISDVRSLKAKNPRLGIGEFKELTGVSRKYAIPLLEYLDRQRVTRRVGEDRLIL
jgi:selenocysteine-specific elongation factor